MEAHWQCIHDLWSSARCLSFAAFSLVAAYVAARVAWYLYGVLVEEKVPDITVDLTPVERQNQLGKEGYIYVPRKNVLASNDGRINCYDPATMQYLGFLPALKPEEVQKHVAQAREAQAQWAKSSFAQRRKLLKILQKYIINNQELICRVSARDSGKPMVDASFGEVMTTCEKIRWLLAEGEKWLKPERRSAGAMMVHKKAYVEYHPLGVLGAIVPWNYPFHNILNPMVAGVFAGNAVVIKVSELASWSASFYSSIIHAALEAAGAPTGLVHIITGYAETGQALVESGVDKLTFVGSTQVGKRVMQAASRNLTPVVLELGGKDPFIVCDDADLGQVIPVALRAAFQSSGQNCAGAERYYIHTTIYDEFVAKVVAIVQRIRMGSALGASLVDMGAICMPAHAEKVQALVDEAVAKGAEVLAGGCLPDSLGGQFYPPTVLTKVTPGMRIMQEEIFGPVMCIVKVADDEEAVALANDCSFGLGCSVFSKNRQRAKRIASRVKTGMVSINDFNATYMCQSLPFGGVKDSGFDRFGGVEGLRGCCRLKAVTEDRITFLKTEIPKALQYPVAPTGFAVNEALILLFFGLSLSDKAFGVWQLLKCLLAPALHKEQRAPPSSTQSLGESKSEQRNGGLH